MNSTSFTRPKATVRGSSSDRSAGSPTNSGDAEFVALGVGHRHPGRTALRNPRWTWFLTVFSLARHGSKRGLRRRATLPFGLPDRAASPYLLNELAPAQVGCRSAPALDAARMRPSPSRIKPLQQIEVRAKGPVEPTNLAASRASRPYFVHASAGRSTVSGLALSCHRSPGAAGDQRRLGRRDRAEVLRIAHGAPARPGFAARRTPNAGRRNQVALRAAPPVSEPLGTGQHVGGQGGGPRRSWRERQPWIEATNFIKVRRGYY